MAWPAAVLPCFISRFLYRPLVEPGTAKLARRNPGQQTQYPGPRKVEVSGCSQLVSKHECRRNGGIPWQAWQACYCVDFGPLAALFFCRHCDMIEIRPLFIAVCAAFTAASLRHDKRVRNDAAGGRVSKREFFLNAKRHLRVLRRCIRWMF